MLLNETDAITTELIQRTLETGIQQLTPIQRQVVKCIFLERISAPKRYLRERHGLTGQDVDSEIEKLLSSLRDWFRSSGISRLSDLM